MSIAIDHVGALEGRFGRWFGYYARTSARKVDSVSSCHAISQLLPGLALVALDIVGRGVQTIRPSFPGTAHRVSLTAGLWQPGRNPAGSEEHYECQPKPHNEATCISSPESLLAAKI